MAKPKRIGHLVINVKDVDASTKFYTEVLGFEIALERPGFGTFLTCGSIHHDLALFQAPEGAKPVTEGGLGLNHMAIQVEDFAELTDYYNNLQQYFEKSDLRTVDHSMTRSIYITDPDGNLTSEYPHEIKSMSSTKLVFISKINKVDGSGTVEEEVTQNR